VGRAAKETGKVSKGRGPNKGERTSTRREGVEKTSNGRHAERSGGAERKRVSGKGERRKMTGK